MVFVLYLKPAFYFDDEHEYWKMVENFLQGRGLIVGENLKAYRPPLYPLFLVLFAKFGIGLKGIRISQCLISTASIYLVYCLGKRIYNKKVGILAAGISSIYPFFIFYSGFLLTETLFVFLVAWCVLSFIKLTEKNVLPFYGFVSGGVCGLAGLCRPTMELFFPFCVLFVLCTKQEMKNKLKKMAFAIAGFILVLSMWVIRNYIVLGKFVPGTTMGGAVFWEGNNPYSQGGPCRYFPEGVWQIEESKRDAVFYSLTFDCIKKDPHRFTLLLWKKFIRFWNVVPNASEYSGTLYNVISVLSFGLLIPFFVLGMFVPVRNCKTGFLIGIIAFFTIFHMIFIASIRYRIAIEPFVILFASAGFLWLVDSIKGKINI
ncbi:MAG TPA: glycosyltransferase family 39 protein [bacterium]|nr:glycosyltransferase family 39 protein [bacterium]HOL34560.1 glycosyltransferase family 39 protein [bacterium]